MMMKGDKSPSKARYEGRHFQWLATTDFSAVTAAHGLSFLSSYLCSAVTAVTFSAVTAATAAATTAAAVTAAAVRTTAAKKKKGLRNQPFHLVEKRFRQDG